jgi:hypothetical protein
VGTNVLSPKGHGSLRIVCAIPVFTNTSHDCRFSHLRPRRQEFGLFRAPGALLKAHLKFSGLAMGAEPAKPPFPPLL